MSLTAAVTRSTPSGAIRKEDQTRERLITMELQTYSIKALYT